MDKDLADIANINMDFVFTDKEKNIIVDRALTDLAPFDDDLNEWEKEFVFDLEVRNGHEQKITDKQVRKLMEIRKKFI